MTKPKTGMGVEGKRGASHREGDAPFALVFGVLRVRVKRGAGGRGVLVCMPVIKIGRGRKNG